MKFLDTHVPSHGKRYRFLLWEGEGRYTYYIGKVVTVQDRIVYVMNPFKKINKMRIEDFQTLTDQNVFRKYFRPWKSEIEYG